MSALEELNGKGYSVIFSIPSPVKSWGEWQVMLKKDNNARVAGYGSNEQEAFENALKTVTK